MVFSNKWSYGVTKLIYIIINIYVQKIKYTNIYQIKHNDKTL